MDLKLRRYLKMVRLISIIKIYFLFKQSQWVSNKEMSDMLGQQMINACKEKACKDWHQILESTVLKVQ